LSLRLHHDVVLLLNVSLYALYKGITVNFAVNFVYGDQEY